MLSKNARSMSGTTVSLANTSALTAILETPTLQNKAGGEVLTEGLSRLRTNGVADLARAPAEDGSSRIAVAAKNGISAVVGGH